MKNINQKFKEILKNNGGTFGEHKRFIVSITNTTFKESELTLKDFKQRISELNKLAKQLNLKNNCFGYWKNNGLIYIDLNISTDNRKHAQAIKITFNQKAFYDVKKNVEIF